MHCGTVNLEKKKERKKERKLLCPLQLCENSINSPNICFIVACSIQVGHENEKNILKTSHLEKFFGDYNVCAVTTDSLQGKRLLSNPSEVLCISGSSELDFKYSSYISRQQK